MRSALFWDFTQRRIVNTVPTFQEVSVPSTRVNQTKSSWTTWPLKIGTMGCPETSVTDYQSTLPNTSEEQKLKNASTFIIVIMENFTRRHNSRLQILYVI